MIGVSLHERWKRVYFAQKESTMHESRFQGDISRLRSPERLARLEVGQVVELSLRGGISGCVLDVGTGSGIFAEAFARAGLACEGVDANFEMPVAAKDLAPAVHFSQGAAEFLPYSSAAFDLVFMGLLLHETDDRLKAMREALRVTRRRVAILEWPYSKQENGPALDERLSEEQIRDLAAQAGAAVREVFPLQLLVLYVVEK